MQENSKRNEAHLQAVTSFGLLPHDIKNGIDELGSFGVVSLGPVVTGAGLAKDKVVRPEDLAIGTRADRVHGSWLQINQHSSWDILPTRSLIVVDINPLQLQLRFTLVDSVGLDAMLIRNDLPEL